MQIPKRKKETYIKPKPDPYLTEAKFQELKDTLARLKDKRPRLALEVRRLAEMGDFSENAGYQLAKSRLRGLNQRLLELEDQVKNAVIFIPNGDVRTVGLGHRVTVDDGGRKKTYTILGSAETDPAAGIISRNSPIGAALLGRAVGEEVEIEVGKKIIKLKILAIDN